MRPPHLLAPLDAETLAAARRRYDQTTDADTRLRYQIVLLAHQGHSVPQIARLVLRSQIARLVLRSDDMVRRVLHRYQAAGLDAVPRRSPPGRERTVTPAWEAELLRVIDLDPHEVGVPSANWTTGLLASYLAQVTGIAVDPETVRLYLHAHDYVCKRPTWTLKRKAQEREDYLGNACG
jgi:transposase